MPTILNKTVRQFSFAITENTLADLDERSFGQRTPAPTGSTAKGIRAARASVEDAPTWADRYHEVRTSTNQNDLLVPFVRISPKCQMSLTEAQAVVLSIIDGGALRSELARHDGFALSSDWPLELLPAERFVPPPVPDDANGQAVDVRVVPCP